MELDPFCIPPTLAHAAPMDPFRDNSQPAVGGSGSPVSAAETSMHNLLFMAELMGPLLPEDDQLCQEPVTSAPATTSSLPAAKPSPSRNHYCCSNVTSPSDKCCHNTGRNPLKQTRDNSLASHQHDLEAILGGQLPIVNETNTSISPNTRTEAHSQELHCPKNGISVSTGQPFDQAAAHDFRGTTVLRSPTAATALSNDFLSTVTFQEKNVLGPPSFLSCVTAAPTQSPLAYPCSPVTPPPPSSTPVPSFPALALKSSHVESPPLTPRSSLPLKPAASCSTPASKRGVRKPKTYMKPIASRFCHICSRMPRRGQGSAVCRNMKRGLCRKIVCERCIVEQGWNFKAITADKDSWLCPHCAGVCPARSQCHIYNKINARRKRCGDDCAEMPKQPSAVPESASLSIGSGSSEEHSPCSTTLGDCGISTPVCTSDGNIQDSLLHAKTVSASLSAPFQFLLDGEF